MPGMRTFIIELTITERQVVEVDAETMEAAQGKVKDGIGRWIHHPSRLMETKILREIPSEEREAHKRRSWLDWKLGV